MLELPPLGLYIHIPWCVRKCPYCDFNSHEASSILPESDYVQALCDDFDQDFEFIQGRSIQSVFIGGGTPSLFSAGAYQHLFQHLRRRADFALDCEITLEANPGTAEAAKFAAYRDAGINRLSLGIQSFDDAQLNTLGRIHSADEARIAIAIARAVGFDNFNLDLMFGLPDQSPAQALHDLQRALEYQPTHLSWYQLTIEPNTVFYNKPPPIPAEEPILEMQELGQQLLETRSYARYEVSAYARSGRESLHNLNYWQFGDYLGIGAGAHGKVSKIVDGALTVGRTRKIKQPKHYLVSSVNRCAEHQQLKASDLPLEFLLNALRLKRGFTELLFEQRTGVSFSTIGKRVEYLVSQGMLARDELLIRPTDKGYALLNSVLEEFI